MRLEVDSGGYDSAAEALVGGNTVLAGGYTSLTSRLGGFSAMAGDDAASEDSSTATTRPRRRPWPRSPS